MQRARKNMRFKKKWHLKLIMDDEVMLDQRNVEDVSNSDVADINLTN